MGTNFDKTILIKNVLKTFTGPKPQIINFYIGYKSFPVRVNIPSQPVLYLKYVLVMKIYQIVLMSAYVHTET